jgi:hypothetical protein
MASIVEWQALRMQEYRFALLAGVAGFFEWFGVRRPVRYEPRPAPAGDYDHAIHIDHPEAPSLLEGYLGSRKGARVSVIAADDPRSTTAAAPGPVPTRGLSHE